MRAAQTALRRPGLPMLRPAVERPHRETLVGRGVQQPLVVVPQGADRPYLLLDGHRRYAAAEIAGLSAVP